MQWSDIEEIVDNLEENFPEEDIYELKAADIEEMVRSLNDFEDQETQVTKKILNDILEAWMEFREENQE